MQTVEREALVPYSADTMYELVRDVARYPEFLSWCTGAEVLEEWEDGMRGRIHLQVAGIRQHFTTRNTHVPGRQITIELEDGPFTSLSGTWTFTPLGELGSKVAVRLTFAFSSGLVNLAFSRGFAAIADRMVNDFVQRAEALHERN